MEKICQESDRGQGRVNVRVQREVRKKCNQNINLKKKTPKISRCKRQKKTVQEVGMGSSGKGKSSAGDKVKRVIPTLKPSAVWRH